VGCLIKTLLEIYSKPGGERILLISWHLAESWGKCNGTVLPGHGVVWITRGEGVTRLTGALLCLHSAPFACRHGQCMAAVPLAYARPVRDCEAVLICWSRFAHESGIERRQRHGKCPNLYLLFPSV